VGWADQRQSVGPVAFGCGALIKRNEGTITDLVDLRGIGERLFAKKVVVSIIAFDEAVALVGQICLDDSLRDLLPWR